MKKCKCKKFVKDNTKKVHGAYFYCKCGGIKTHLELEQMNQCCIKY